MMTDQELQSLRNLGNESEAAADEITRLRAENENLRKDAERYRWLRGDACTDQSPRWMQWEVRCWMAPRWTDDLRRHYLDTAIDRAMQAEVSG